MDANGNFDEPQPLQWAVAPTVRARPVSPRLARWQVRRVQEYIAARLGEPIRNRDLAALAGLSEFHFNVAFRNSVGDSPHRYVVRQRVDRARQLMLSTRMRLSEIACECGLADQAHLSRLFRSIVGESPAAWRRARVMESMDGDPGGGARYFPAFAEEAASSTAPSILNV